MNVHCEGCETVYRVDPRKVPAEGVRARCERCDQVIFVRGEQSAFIPAGSPQPDMSGEWESPVATAFSEDVSEGAEGSGPATEGRAESSGFESHAKSESPETQPSAAQVAAISDFGRDDPDTRARRLATALISDIKAYYPDRWREGLERGTLREDLREEIRKSWDEYTSQVGDSMARSTSYFRDALNRILGEGRRLF